MYRVGIKRAFEASHFLIGDFGNETRPHSHEYSAHWIIETETLDRNGFSANIALMEELLEETTESLREVQLNDLPFFRGKQPSVENTAQFLLQELFRKIRAAGKDAGKAGENDSGIELYRLKKSEMQVWESPNAWASYIHETQNKPA